MPTELRCHDDNLQPHNKPSYRPAELGAHDGGKRTPFFQPRLNTVARFPQLVYRWVHLWCTVPKNMVHLWCTCDTGLGDRTFPSLVFDPVVANTSMVLHQVSYWPCSVCCKWPSSGMFSKPRVDATLMSPMSFKARFVMAWWGTSNLDHNSPWGSPSNRLMGSDMLALVGTRSSQCAMPLLLCQVHLETSFPGKFVARGHLSGNKKVVG